MIQASKAQLLTWSSSCKLWTVRVLPSVSSSISIPSVMKIGSWGDDDYFHDGTYDKNVDNDEMVWISIPSVMKIGSWFKLQPWWWWFSFWGYRVMTNILWLSNLVFLPEDVRPGRPESLRSELENIFKRCFATNLHHRNPHIEVGRIQFLFI